MTDHKHFNKGVRNRDQDPTAVGTSNRHVQNDEAERRVAHTGDEKPRLIGEYDTKPAADDTD